MTQVVTRRAGTNATHSSTRQPRSCTCQRQLVLGLGASPGRACLAWLREPRDSERWSALPKHCGSGRPGPRITQTPTLTRACRHGRGEAAAAAPRSPISPCRSPGSPPTQGRVPPHSGRTLLDRHGREKAGKRLCPGEGAPPVPAGSLVGSPCSEYRPPLRAPIRTWGAHVPS